MEKTKKLIAMLLTVMMLLSILPVAAFADGDAKTYTLVLDEENSEGVWDPVISITFTYSMSFGHNGEWFIFTRTPEEYEEYEAELGQLIQVNYESGKLSTVQIYWDADSAIYLPCPHSNSTEAPDATCQHGGVHPADGVVSVPDIFCCSVCGAYLDENGAELTEKQLADYISLDPIDHSFTGSYVIGEGEHEGQHGQHCFYDGCTEIGDWVAHDFSNGDCICGEKKPAPHEHAAGTSHDAVAATCTEDGNVAYCDCTDASCGYKLVGENWVAAEDTVVSKTGHNFSGAAVSNGNGRHSFKCVNGDCTAVGIGTDIGAEVPCDGGEATCCELARCSECGGEYGDLAEHTPTNEKATKAGESTLVSAATCTDDAVYNKVCSVCDKILGDRWTDEGSALGHNFTGEAVNRGNGRHSFKCVNDGCTLIGIGTDIDAEDLCDGGEATCVSGAICDTCNAEYTDPNFDNHCFQVILDDDSVVAATCVSKGYSGDKHCSECGEVVEAGKETDIDPTNHCGEAILDETTVKAATCVAKGYTGDKICSECKAVVEAGTATDIDPNNHATEGRTPVEAQKATCQHVGWDAYEVCACGEKLGYNEYPQLDHSYTGAVKDNGDGTHSFKCVNGCNEYGGTENCVDETGDGKCDKCGATLDPLAKDREAAIAKLEALVNGNDNKEVQKMLASYVDQINNASSLNEINSIVAKATSALKNQIEIANEGSLVSAIRAFVNLCDHNHQRTTTKVMGIIKPILGIFGIR